MPLLARHMHDRTQDFVQTGLARPLRKAFKAKKSIETVMMQMRAIAGDWISLDSVEDFKQVKDEIEKMIRDYPRRATPATSTQVSQAKCSPIGSEMEDKQNRQDGGVCVCVCVCCFAGAISNII